MDTVWSRRCILPSCQYYFQVGFADGYLLFVNIMLRNQFTQLNEVTGTFLDFPASKFALNQSISSVIQMQNYIGLQAISVTIVSHVGEIAFGICAQIPDAHLLEYEAECLHLRPE